MFDLFGSGLTYVQVKPIYSRVSTLTKGCQICRKYDIYYGQNEKLTKKKLFMWNIGL